MIARTRFLEDLVGVVGWVTMSLRHQSPDDIPARVTTPRQRFVTRLTPIAAIRLSPNAGISS